jgi:hypothetical protein
MARCLIEILHELRAKKLGGILLKLDFEKTYDHDMSGLKINLTRAK